jgi:hypothetical protein
VRFKGHYIADCAYKVYLVNTIDMYQKLCVIANCRVTIHGFTRRPTFQNQGPLASRASRSIGRGFLKGQSRKTAPCGHSNKGSKIDGPGAGVSFKCGRSHVTHQERSRVVPRSFRTRDGSSRRRRHGLGGTSYTSSSIPSTTIMARGRIKAYDRYQQSTISYLVLVASRVISILVSKQRVH